jgi:hypothetical protein
MYTHTHTHTNIHTYTHTHTRIHISLLHTQMLVTPDNMDERAQVHPAQVKKNGGAQEGDILILSKPIGVGVLSAALKKQMLEDEGYKTLLKWTCKVIVLPACTRLSACASMHTHTYELHIRSCLQIQTQMQMQMLIHTHTHNRSSTHQVLRFPRCPTSMPSQT